MAEIKKEKINLLTKHKKEKSGRRRGSLKAINRLRREYAEKEVSSQACI